EFQNTQFGLAECKSEATIARVFHDHCIERYLSGTLDTVTASMAKYWITDLQGKIIDRCLQFFGGYGYMEEFPISRMYRAARVMGIYPGTKEIRKLLTESSLGCADDGGWKIEGRNHPATRPPPAPEVPRPPRRPLCPTPSSTITFARHEGVARQMA